MKLKILILGGASGDIGRDLTRILLRDKQYIDAITITSRNIEYAQKYVKELDDKRLSALNVDVTNSLQLTNSMDGHNLVINTVGPFEKYVIPVIKAAIESKVNYIDICDDINPTIEALQLDQFAKDAGVFILLSMGWFPGMSNLRGKWLADQMDNVEEIVMAWVAGKKSPEEKPSKGLAGIEHYLKALTGEIYTFRNGRRVKIPVNRKAMTLTFPKPLGNYSCYQMEHPETATLPYVILGIKNASILGSLYPQNRNRTIQFYTRFIDLKLVSIPFITTFFGMFMQSKKKTNLPTLNASYIACIGLKNGKKGQLRYSEVNTAVTTSEATSQPLACSILLIASKDGIKPGVHLPENAIKIKELLDIGKRLNLPFVCNIIGETVWSEEINSIDLV